MAVKIKEGEEYYFWSQNHAIGKPSLMLGTLYKCEKEDCQKLSMVNGAWLTSENDKNLIAMATLQANQLGQIDSELCATEDGESFCETCYYKDNIKEWNKQKGK